MWLALPEEQAAIWLSELQTHTWDACDNPEAVLQTIMEQWVGADPAGSDSIRQYLEFRPAKNKSYTAAWHRFMKVHAAHFAQNILPANTRKFSQVCNQFVLNWPDHSKKARIIDALTRFPPLCGKPN